MIFGCIKPSLDVAQSQAWTEAEGLVSHAASKQTGLRPACNEIGKEYYTDATVWYLPHVSFLDCD
jgi:hypothetical protein